MRLRERGKREGKEREKRGKRGVKEKYELGLNSSWVKVLERG